MNKISYYKKRITEEIRIHRVRKSLNLSDVTVISQNCIGGVLYHDCNAKFLSPTVNLYFLPSDFIKFVLNLDFYLNETPTVSDEGKFPVGTFSDGLKIYFMHYKDKEEALEKWESRKKRIIKNKMFFIFTDRDGFSQKDYDDFQKINYPKVLFTVNESWKDDLNCIFLPKYKKHNQIPDIIPKRDMYYKYKLSKAIKKAFEK